MTNVHQYPAASIREQQIAVSALAHAARRDVVALTGLLTMIQDPAEKVRPAYVIAALLIEFQKGMDEADTEELALRFCREAHALAIRTDLT